MRRPLFSLPLIKALPLSVKMLSGFVVLLASPALAQQPKADAWSVGQKSLLYIRVDFADDRGEPASLSQVQQEMQDATQFLLDNSQGLFRLSTEFTPVIRLPYTYSQYEAMPDLDIRSFTNQVRAAARAAGYEPNNYQLDIVHYQKRKGTKYPDAFINSVPTGFALHRQRGLMTSTPDGRTLAHELGHNLNLTHSHGASWEPSEDSPIGAGERKTRGNPFDRMGSEYSYLAHFNSRAKYQLGWIGPTGVQTVTRSGSYVIQAHDSPNAKGVRALEIPIPGDPQKKYWVEFRQLFTDNAWTSNGALIHWSYANGTTDLLDMTPSSRGDMKDAALTVGRTFSDPTSQIHLTVVRRIEGNPASLEIMVQLSPRSNRAPRLQIEATDQNWRRGAPVSFAANASDSDGDRLFYFWEFDDGQFYLTSAPTVERTYSRNGRYAVRCTVSDGKGGVDVQTYDFMVQ